MDFLAPDSPSLVVRLSSFLLAQGGYLSYGSFMTNLREEGGGGGGQSGFLASAI